MTKEPKLKIEAERIYDHDGYWLRVACVCIRDINEGEVLLVSSSRRPESWIIPGGKIQHDEKPEVSALREAKEEAGVIGIIGRSLGVFDNNDRKHRTQVFILKVTQILDEFEDMNTRQRSWFSVDKAIKLLFPYKPIHCKYLQAMMQSKIS